MNNFLKLTMNTGKPVWVALDKIQYFGYRWDQPGAFLVFSESDEHPLTVKESPSEILAISKRGMQVVNEPTR